VGNFDLEFGRENIAESAGLNKVGNTDASDRNISSSPESAVLNFWLLLTNFSSKKSIWDNTQKRISAVRAHRTTRLQNHKGAAYEDSN
jgi:hypothetical protein